jgi:type II secretory ATPase GspE/PulE/Tfp pilus assembly ATPase PilB-like protein
MQEEGGVLLVPEAGTPEDKIAAVAHGILKLAVTRRATDVHLEPGNETGRVRFRDDGVLHLVRDMPMVILGPVVSRFKELGGMNTEERSVPQDGRIVTEVEEHKLEVRVATFPAVNGEALTMRLLSSNMVMPGLADFSSVPEELKPLRDFLELSHGVVLVVGPTGSGKTSTVYAMLQDRVDQPLKIVTIEDPAELPLPGVVQSNVNVRSGYTFAAATRAFLHSDPDIIYIGEIRDYETAELALRGSLYGHLIFSTMPVKEAAEAVARLGDMGVEPFMVATALSGVVAQRLVRRVCPHCAEDAEPSDELVEKARVQMVRSGLEWPQAANWRRGTGCPRCRRTGYLGRLPIMEILTMNDALREAVTRGEGLATIRQLALESGMVGLTADGVRKAARGETTLDEVFRIAS